MRYSLNVKSKSPEFISFIIMFTSLSALIQPLFTSLNSPLWIIIFLELLILGMTFEIAELISAVMVHECDLPRLSYLNEYPPVAIIFLVCDDIVPLALARLGKQGYSRADVFILDDSNDPLNQHLLDSTGLRVVRRRNRRGYKAGCLNDWLRCYGSRYKYFLILDSDSIIPEDFVENIIKYAEHPANARIAIFNTLPECWNRYSRFPRLLATVTPLRNWIGMRLANRSPSILSSGHNNLHRTEALIEVGGFDENFIAEDIAVTIKLMKAGYTSKLVNLVGYEAEPEHIFSYVRRLNRWAKQTIQIQSADWRGIPLSVKFQMLKLTWMYFSFFLYPIWAILVAWGAKSSLADVQTLIATLIYRDVRVSTVYILFIAATMVPLVVPIIKIPLLIRLGISLRDYAGNCLLSLAIGFYAMLTVCGSQIAAATSSTLEFDVTDKHSQPITFLEILLHHPYLIPFWLFLIIGFWRNPVALFFSALWILVLLLAPLLIYLFHEPRAANAIFASTPDSSKIDRR